MVRRSPAVALGIALACAWAHPGAARTIDFADLRSEVGLSAPAISPDGNSIAVVTSRADFDKDLFVHQIILIDAATGAQRALTQGRDDVNSPTWSPSGDRLAFISEDGTGDDAPSAGVTVSLRPVR